MHSFGAHHRDVACVAEPVMPRNSVCPGYLVLTEHVFVGDDGGIVEWMLSCPGTLSDLHAGRSDSTRSRPAAPILGVSQNLSGVTF